MVTKADIEALLEDGPELPAQLAEWLEMDPVPLRILLDRLAIPTCEHCYRRFLRRHLADARFCSDECDRNEVPAVLGAGALRTGSMMSHSSASTSTERSAGTKRRNDGYEFEVVWSGSGPLPGVGGAAGLGSTLSGIHFLPARRS
jgi:hypothetical protein